MSGIERRRFRRVNIVTEVEIVSEKETLLAPTRDISIGGMFLKTTATPPINTPVELRFSLDPGTPVLHATGQIVYIVPGRGLGIEFAELSDENRGRIQEFVERAEPGIFPSEELPSV